MSNEVALEKHSLSLNSGFCSFIHRSTSSLVPRTLVNLIMKDVIKFLSSTHPLELCKVFYSIEIKREMLQLPAGCFLAKIKGQGTKLGRSRDDGHWPGVFLAKKISLFKRKSQAAGQQMPLYKCCLDWTLAKSRFFYTNSRACRILPSLSLSLGEQFRTNNQRPQEPRRT